MRWVLRGVAGGTLALGWLFILWQNNFHLTVPVAVIGLGYLAVVATIANLWRVGAAAVAPEDNSPDAWARPVGARVELEKEKKTLLKAIKEAEFDHEMGKLSKADADDLIRTYRARAIEVIKEIDRLDAGQAGSTREQIEREVQARLALDSKGSKKDKRKAAADAKAKADATKAKPTAKADEAKAKADDAKPKADEAKAELAEPPPESAPETKDDASEATP
ncbi:MAG TPA: hypothetical protein VFS15_23760 [Kofleriaceae bacterium]|nr:hypothetical protein [Kofleriaceae bacterium]